MTLKQEFNDVERVTISERALRDGGTAVEVTVAHSGMLFTTEIAEAADPHRRSTREGNVTTMNDPNDSTEYALLVTAEELDYQAERFERNDSLNDESTLRTGWAGAMHMVVQLLRERAAEIRGDVHE